MTSLPPSVNRINIVKCRQHYILETRKLPRCLRTLHMQKNAIYGTLDLRNLPPHIEGCILWDNRIVGPISLVSVPPQLTILHLFDNRIAQRVVFYGSLPKRLNQILLTSNDIRHVRSIDANSVDDPLASRIVFSKRLIK